MHSLRNRGLVPMIVSAIVYRIYTSRQDQDPELQADKYNCLFNISNWMRNGHLKLNVFKTEIPIVFRNLIPSAGFINSVMKVLDLWFLRPKMLHNSGFYFFALKLYIRSQWKFHLLYFCNMSRILSPVITLCEPSHRSSCFHSALLHFILNIAARVSFSKSKSDHAISLPKTMAPILHRIKVKCLL